MRILLVAILLMATVACGKKGPPLLPFVRAPKAAEITTARRVGSDVYLTVAVPTANVDDSTPASVAQIEVWGVTTTTPPSPLQFTTIGTLVATIPVARYADPSDQSGKVVPDPKTGALQGASVTIRDSLTADELIARELPAPKGVRPTAALPPPAPAPDVPRRFYMTIPASDRRRPGPPSMVVEVPMTLIPEKVPAVRIGMQGHNVALQWEPAGGVIGFLLDRALAVEAPPIDSRQPTPSSGTPPPPVPSGPVLYNVYRDQAADPLALPAKPPPDTPWAVSSAVPINAQPLTTPTFSEEVPFDERERCYYVRAVRGTAAQRAESEPSERTCIVPVDTEPPTAPTGLSATVMEGSILLQWEPNGEEDWQGYIVLRGEAGSDTLQALTPKPIADTRFTDSTRDLVPGRMYTYVVRAVDNRIPLPNVSDPTPITVTAR